jgi:hypothetical protein
MMCFWATTAKTSSACGNWRRRLHAAGLRVWFDDWVIRAGDAIYLAIEHGLEASRTLVLCMSPAAFDSDWVGLEHDTVLFRDPTNRERRFIPVSLADCDMPAALWRRRDRYIKRAYAGAVK